MHIPGALFVLLLVAAASADPIAIPEPQFSSVRNRGLLGNLFDTATNMATNSISNVKDVIKGNKGVITGAKDIVAETVSGAEQMTQDVITGAQDAIVPATGAATTPAKTTPAATTPAATTPAATTPAATTPVASTPAATTPAATTPAATTPAASTTLTPASTATAPTTSISTTESKPGLISGAISKIPGLGGIKIPGISSAVAGIKGVVGNLTQGADAKARAEVMELLHQASQSAHAIPGLDNCSCNITGCQCCADQKSTGGKSLCMGVFLKPEIFEVQYGLLLNEEFLIKGSASGRHPEPICGEISKLRGGVCLRAYDITLGQDGFRVCFQVESKLFTKTVASINLNCLVLSRNSISLQTATQRANKGVVDVSVATVLKPFLDLNNLTFHFPFTFPKILPF